MKQKKMLKNLKMVKDKDELLKIVLLRHIRLPFYNLNANFYKTIRLTMKFIKTENNDEVVSVMKKSLKKSIELYLDDVSPLWKETVKKFTEHFEYLMTDFDVRNYK